MTIILLLGGSDGGSPVSVDAGLPVVGQMPRGVFLGGALPAQGVAASMILWDDGTLMLWDDGSVIEWDDGSAIVPDMAYQFSIPKTTHTGSAE